MRRIVKNSWFAVILMTWGMVYSSCEDWTDPESIDIHYPTFEEQNPQLYADYIRDLKNYKAGEHKLVFVSFDNPVGNPSNQVERLIAIPDSVDFVCLNNSENLSNETQVEMVKIREKSIRTLSIINYESLEQEWNKKAKENSELTEEDAQKYLNERTDAMLALCDSYGYDGILIDYTGLSMVGMQEAVLQQYKTRQQNFFSRVLDWRNKHANKTLVLYSYVQYLAPENMDMLDEYNHLILKTVSSKNMDDLTLNVLMAIQAGIDAAGMDANPVPKDRFVACAQLPQQEDKDMIIGYWNTQDANGNKTLAAQGTAQWIVQSSPTYTRAGIFITNIQKDYYNNTYAAVRETIHIMNPNK
uniref:Glycoside hydrolase Family 18, chitinase_18 n=1 Tax=uncultured bacterium 40k7 TaxID=1701370 RepID=A0A0M4BX52_9BACT|nr:conserved hypothetical protein [uncultured bacterium 40k7]